MAAVAQKSGVFHEKKIASLTGNTGEALQCVRLHQKAREGACRQFNLTTKNIFISGTLRRSLRWDLVLEAEKKFFQLRKEHYSGQLYSGFLTCTIVLLRHLQPTPCVI